MPGSKLTDPIIRFEKNYTEDPDTGCWLWTGALAQNTGYGTFSAGSRKAPGGWRHYMAHRWSYEYFVGPIPEGFELDHACHSEAVKLGTCPGGRCDHRRCVNPAHLEVVTHAENVARAARPVLTHCKWGHEFTPENTAMWCGKRHCLACKAIRNRGIKR